MRKVTGLCLLAVGFAIASSGMASPLAPMQHAQVKQKQLQIVPALPERARIRTPDDGERSAYLLTYFKDETHSLYFAVSRDGYNFMDVNGGEPILSGRDVADQKGIRDPHIMRGPDNAFYMSMTDLHIFAQREGLRDSQWERSESEYGWGNNRNILLMKSYDLIHWTLSKVDISKLFPAFRTAGSAWAPQTIYDPKRKKMMVYFTTRIKNAPNVMVYSYANPDFTSLETEPVQLLHYPRSSVNTIDADITKIGDKYRMFYVVHENPGNIRQAVSRKINGEYVYSPEKVDPEGKSAEAPNLWKRHGTDTYVLMYDVYGASPNNMGFAETKDFVHFKDIGRFNDPSSPMKATNFSSPKHGAVMAITPAEADRIEAYFRN